MPITKLDEFAKDGEKNTTGLALLSGFPAELKPQRRWFNWLFNALALKINELIDVVNNPAVISDASTTQKGVVQLNDSLTSNSTTQAATANAVRQLRETTKNTTDMLAIVRPNLVAGLESFTMSPPNSFYAVEAENWCFRYDSRTPGTNYFDSQLVLTRPNEAITVTADTMKFTTTGWVGLGILWFDANQNFIRDSGFSQRLDNHDYSVNNSNRDANVKTDIAPANARYFKVRFAAVGISSSPELPLFGVRMIKAEFGDIATEYTTETELRGKIDKTALANNLSTNDPNRPGSAAMLVYLKSLIDGLGGAGSLSGNGFYILPNGLILQWGVFSKSADPQTVSFPIQFPQTCIYVGLQVDGAETQYIEVSTVYGSPSTASFQVNSVYITGSPIYVLNSGVQRFFAVGF